MDCRLRRNELTNASVIETQYYREQTWCCSKTGGPVVNWTNRAPIGRDSTDTGEGITIALSIWTEHVECASLLASWREQAGSLAEGGSKLPHSRGQVGRKHGFAQCTKVFRTQPVIGKVFRRFSQSAGNKERGKLRNSSVNSTNFLRLTSRGGRAIM